MTSKRNYVIAAADRALMVLEVLANERELGVTDVADRMGITKSLAFRLLHTLEARGYVSRHPERRTYSLGYRVLYLGNALGQQDSLVQATAAHMDELADRTHENVNLVVREGTGSMVVATRESRHQVRLFAEAGRRGPLHAGGASTVLLAYAPAEIQDEVLRSDLTTYSPATVTDPEKLRAVLQTVRDRGFHVAKNDLDDGAFSIAAPIRDRTGQVIAAVSVAGPLSRLDEVTATRLMETVPKYAARMSQQLGLTTGNLSRFAG